MSGASMKGPKPLAGSTVTVIGAGLAGIAAALEAADLGARVTLLERSQRLGGLTWSFERNGLSMDNGQHVFLACCSEYQRFLARIGSDRDVVGPLPLDIAVVAESPNAKRATTVSLSAARLRRRDLPVPFHLAGSLLRYPHISIPARLALGRALAAIARLRLDDPRLDQVSFADWLRAHGQSSEAIEAVWDLITVPTVNLPAEQASLSVAAQVFQTGLLSSRSACDIGWSNVPLGRLHGERSRSALGDAGVQIKLGTRAQRLVRHDEGWQIAADTGPLGADAVVVAVPSDEAASLVPQHAAPSRDRWSGLGSSAVIDVHLIFDRTVMAWPVMAALHSSVQWVFDRSEASGLLPSRRVASSPVLPSAPRDPRGAKRSMTPQYLAVSLSAADSLLGDKPSQIVDSVAGSLRRLLPAAWDAVLVDSVVTKERRATFCASPGTAALRAGTATRDPSLVLAGAWTDTGWPATMEGAVRSGRDAARALAGMPATPPSGVTAPYTDIQTTREVA